MVTVRGNGPFGRFSSLILKTLKVKVSKVETLKRQDGHLKRSALDASTFDLLKTKISRFSK